MATEKKAAGGKEIRPAGTCGTSDTAGATDYTLNELMTVLAAREIHDGDVVFVGIGLPNLACNLARRTHAPNMCLIYESGAVGAAPDRVPPSIGDPPW